MVKKMKKETLPETAEGLDNQEEKQTGHGDADPIETLTGQLQEKEREAAENYDKYVRAVADLENYKKRVARDKADSLKYGQEHLIKDMLPVVDSLERAMEHACSPGDSGDLDVFKEGLQLVQNQLRCCLEKHGVEKIEAQGKAFDPNVHEAMMQVESPGHGHNEVVQEFEKGYLLNGRLLRPSKVSVCSGPATLEQN